ncbi:MAG: hypothetical protein WEC15_04800, partial [Flavobacteriales bacterium]
MRTQGLLKNMALLVLMLLGVGATAQTKYWIGGSGNWSEGARWSFTQNGPGGAGIPRANEDVVIAPVGDATITLPAQAWCRDLRIDAGGRNVQLRGSAPAELHVAGGWSMIGGVRWNYMGDVRLSMRRGGVELDL